MGAAARLDPMSEDDIGSPPRRRPAPTDGIIDRAGHRRKSGACRQIGHRAWF